MRKINGTDISDIWEKGRLPALYGVCDIYLPFRIVLIKTKFMNFYNPINNRINLCPIIILILTANITRYFH